MDKKLMLLLVGLLFGAVTLMAQKRVTGNVTDADGAPVIGATIKVNGTKVAAVTDAEGKFVLPNVPASAKTLSVLSSLSEIKQKIIVIATKVAIRVNLNFMECTSNCMVEILEKLP